MNYDICIMYIYQLLCQKKLRSIRTLFYKANPIKILNKYVTLQLIENIEYYNSFLHLNTCDIYRFVSIIYLYHMKR